MMIQSSKSQNGSKKMKLLEGNPWGGGLAASSAPQPHLPEHSQTWCSIQDTSIFCFTYLPRARARGSAYLD